MPNHREAGLALLPTLLLLFVIAAFLALFVEEQNGSSLSIGNHLSRHLLALALDQGAADASATLNGYNNWPEILTANNANALSPAYIAGGLPTNQNPNAVATPGNGFWQSCVANNQCATFQVTENGVLLSGEYVIYSANSLTQKISGYEDQQAQVGPTSRQYIAFVYVTNLAQSIEVQKEYVLRKTLL